MKNFLLLGLLLLVPSFASAQTIDVDLELQSIDAESQTATGLYVAGTIAQLVGGAGVATGMVLATGCIFGCGDSEPYIFGLIIGGGILFLAGIATTISGIVFDIQSGARRRRLQHGVEASFRGNGFALSW